MAEETPLSTAPSSETKISDAVSVPSTQPTTNAAVKPKTNRTLVTLIVLCFLIVGAASFFAGRTTAPSSMTPTPTITQVHQQAPVEQPTRALETPTTSPTVTIAPTTSQATTAPTQAVTPTP